MTWSRTRASPLRSPFQWDPCREIDEIRRAFERISDRSVGRVPVAAAGSAFVPPADLYDADAVFVVRVDLPGVREEDLQIIIEGSTLTIRGRRNVDGLWDERYLCCERPVGFFARTIELPGGVGADHFKATLKLGVLEITLPKSRQLRSRW